MDVKKNFFKNYSLSIVLAILFLSSWIGQLGTQWVEFKNQAKEHNQEAQVSEFMPEFWASTFEN
jgi:hypothetical protein